ncbi:dihydrodipicolinate synthase family protein [Jiella avicenniae]|uniref:Dihydrodipicolinate synthase family protein n=1 Tax=Jiella avicenniae TaxID=2907202 RepID=A0A9X1P377_9HYPH|nr:dihydrodipicolinate synthase family protein [Jiella avicenniae]MCE7029678.1 dihydrodipicolinate synthase family protein [Jiella avicenniae]
MSETVEMPSRNEDLLWVPLLTHYCDESPDAPDIRRMGAHLSSISGDVRQIMLAGSTGDGWELTDDQFESLIDFAAIVGRGPSPSRILFGLLRPDTDGVLDRLRRLQARLGSDDGLRSCVEGVAVCPPVGSELDQQVIEEHYRQILAASDLPLAVYQLPQVTGCALEPRTVAKIAGNPKVIMFKDSSGIDEVAKSGPDFGSTLMVRGAEGGYVEALKPDGPYDGWLLSTGNALGRELREILRLLEAGNRREAGTLSAEISETVGAVFAEAADEGGANAFSNANRALDHLRAYGMNWRSAARPLKVDGERLSEALLDKVASLAQERLSWDAQGYLE